jgi:hypothetical protein
MRRALAIALIALLPALSACGMNHEDIFPNAPEHSFIRTSIGPGPTGPVGPSSGHTSANPTGARTGR